MKKIFILLGILFVGLCTFANDIDDVRLFFNAYVDAGNNYRSNFFDFYADKPLITRVVIKRNGTTKTVKIPFSEYKRHSIMSAKLGKIRKYKNIYTNIQIVPEGDNYRLTCMRQPSTSNYSLPASFLIGRDSSGKLKIKEESMQTKVQSFLGRK